MISYNLCGFVFLKTTKCLIKNDTKYKLIPTWILIVHTRYEGTSVKELFGRHFIKLDNMLPKGISFSVVNPLVSILENTKMKYVIFISCIYLLKVLITEATVYRFFRKI